jgi:DNA-binding transcriptional regulator YdaS (Cro superfamily)
VIQTAGDAVYRGLTGLSPATEPRTLAGQLEALVRAAGGEGAAARYVGVHPATFRRWRHGYTQPGPRSRPLLRGATRRARLRPGRERLLRQRNAFTISAWWTVSDDRRHRTVNLGPYVAGGLVGLVIDAYLAGDDHQAWVLIDAFAVQDYIPGADVDFTAPPPGHAPAWANGIRFHA